jgi:hypothetical protein
MMDWVPVLARVVVTPPGYRHPADAAYAQSILRCGKADVDMLFAACDEVLDSPLDRFDIWNTGLYSGSRRSRPELEMSYFRRFALRGGDWVAPIRHRVAFEAVCPRGDRCDSDTWPRPDIPGGTWHSSVLEQGRARWAGEVRRRGTTATVSSKLIAEIWRASLERYRFHFTCPALANAIPQTRRRGVGDCTALSLTLAAELGEHGLQARVRSGFLWGGTMGRVHQWVEVADSDAQWKVLDLSMALLADDFAMENYADFCFGSLSNRVIIAGDGDRTSVLHPCGGETLQVDLYIRGPAGDTSGMFTV